MARMIKNKVICKKAVSKRWWKESSTITCLEMLGFGL